MLPPFPRLRGWKAGGWHTFFLSLVHALAHSHAAKFAIFGHETALWHETWLSPERKAFSKQQNPRSEKTTRDRRGQELLDACQNAVSWPKTPGFAARSRKGRANGRKTRIRSAKRPEWKARPPSDVPYACCTPNAWSHPKAPTRPATDPPPPPLHCRRTGDVRKQPCHVRRRHCRVRKQRSARRDKPRTRRDSALPAPCPSRHCRPARVSSAAKPLSREGVGGGAYRAKPSALTAIPTQPRLRRHRHSVTIDNPLQPHSLKARGRPMQTPR